MRLLTSMTVVGCACFGAYMGQKAWGFETTIVLLLGAVVGHLSIVTIKIEI